MLDTMTVPQRKMQCMVMMICLRYFPYINFAIRGPVVLLDPNTRVGMQKTDGGHLIGMAAATSLSTAQLS